MVGYNIEHLTFHSLNAFENADSLGQSLLFIPKMTFIE